jgi:hypothetical protein
LGLGGAKSVRGKEGLSRTTGLLVSPLTFRPSNSSRPFSPYPLFTGRFHP